LNYVVQHSGLYFYGRFQDLLNILSGYPPETTLKEFINLNLN